MHLRLAVIALLVIGLVEGYRCPRFTDTTVPEGFVMKDVSNYPYRESGLQIFSELRIPCDGYITEWRFIAANPLVYGLHLGIFRPAMDGYLQFIDDTYFQTLTTPNSASGVWVYYPLDRPIAVRAGDLIGMFYHNLRTVADLATIVSSTVDEPDVTTPVTYVYLRDSNNLEKEGYVNIRKATRAYRNPALMAIVLGMAEGTQRAIAVDTTEPWPTTEEFTTTTRSPRTFPRPATRPTQPPPPPPPPETTSTLRTTALTEEQTTELYWPAPSPPSRTLAPPQPRPQLRPQPMDPQPVDPQPRPQPRPQPVDPSIRCNGPPTALQVCSRLQLRSFFDYKRGSCEPFFGCESWTNDANNFNSVTECEAFCGNVVSPIGRRPDPECLETPGAATYCQFPGNRWYYDTDTRKCEYFFGCPLQPPANNFATADICQQKCLDGTQAEMGQMPSNGNPRPSVVMNNQLSDSLRNSQVQQDIIPFRSSGKR